MEFTPEERKRFTLKTGDLIVSEASGSPDQVGKPAIWRNEVPGCCFQNTVIRLRPDLDSVYLLWVLLSLYHTKVFARTAGGVGINHLSAGKFSLIPVPIPPIQEQTQIVAEIERRFTIADQVEKTVEQSLKQSRQLRQSILKRAFSGRLVPQDPEDEPAEKLLERIRAGRDGRNGRERRGRAR
jgi:type I restriction enzyme, S subunit